MQDGDGKLENSEQNFNEIEQFYLVNSVKNREFSVFFNPDLHYFFFCYFLHTSSGCIIECFEFNGKFCEMRCQNI